MASFSRGEGRVALEPPPLWEACSGGCCACTGSERLGRERLGEHGTCRRLRLAQLLRSERPVCVVFENVWPVPQGSVLVIPWLRCVAMHRRHQSAGCLIWVRWIWLLICPRPGGPDILLAGVQQRLTTRERDGAEAATVALQGSRGTCSACTAGGAGGGAAHMHGGACSPCEQGKEGGRPPRACTRRGRGEGAGRGCDTRAPYIGDILRPAAHWVLWTWLLICPRQSMRHEGAGASGPSSPAPPDQGRKEEGTRWGKKERKRARGGAAPPSVEGGALGRPEAQAADLPRPWGVCARSGSGSVDTGRPHDPQAPAWNKPGAQRKRQSEGRSKRAAGRAQSRGSAGSQARGRQGPVAGGSVATALTRIRRTPPARAAGP